MRAGKRTCGGVDRCPDDGRRSTRGAKAILRAAKVFPRGERRSSRAAKRLVVGQFEFSAAARFTEPHGRATGLGMRATSSSSSHT
jgi:hypothetical protein